MSDDGVTFGGPDTTDQPSDLFTGYIPDGYGAGPAGPVGAQGPKGDTGPAGAGHEQAWPSAFVAYAASQGKAPQDVLGGWVPIQQASAAFPGQADFAAHVTSGGAGADMGFRREGRLTRLKGYCDVVVGFASGDPLFTMPQGFRPGSLTTFVCVAMHSFQPFTDPVVAGRVTIDTSGVVRYFFGLAPGGAVFPALDDVLVLGWDGFAYSSLDPIS